MNYMSVIDDSTGNLNVSMEGQITQNKFIKNMMKNKLLNT